MARKKLPPQRGQLPGASGDWSLGEDGEQGYTNENGQWITTGWTDEDGYWFEAVFEPEETTGQLEATGCAAAAAAVPNACVLVSRRVNSK